MLTRLIERDLNIIPKCFRSRCLALVPEYKDLWKERLLGDSQESFQPLPDIAALPPSDSTQRASYLGIASEYIPEIKCKLRPKGKEYIELVRKNDLVPCVLNGKLWKKDVDGMVMFETTQNEIMNHYHLRKLKYFVTPHRLVFEDSPEHNCYAFVEKVDLLIDKQKAEHVQFIRFDPDNKERRLVKLPINYWNSAKAPGLKFNGWFNDNLMSLPVWVNSLEYPTLLNINLTGLDHGEAVFVNQISIHPKISVHRPMFKQLLCSVKKMPRGED